MRYAFGEIHYELFYSKRRVRLHDNGIFVHALKSGKYIASDIECIMVAASLQAVDGLGKLKKCGKYSAAAPSATASLTVLLEKQLLRIDALSDILIDERN
jgi:hypothetical protein